MTDLYDEVASLARDLLWSLWAELGVDGAPRRHDWQAIDIEPLIVMTAMAGDSRLKSRTADWCAANRLHLSAPRLSRFGRLLGQATSSSFERYAAAMRHGARPRRPSLVPDLRRPSLIQLRLRALVGVTPRAVVLRLLQ
jgi:hypothetical protein